MDGFYCESGLVACEILDTCSYPDAERCVQGRYVECAYRSVLSVV